MFVVAECDSVTDCWSHLNRHKHEQTKICKLETVMYYAKPCNYICILGGLVRPQSVQSPNKMIGLHKSVLINYYHNHRPQSSAQTLHPVGWSK